MNQPGKILLLNDPGELSIPEGLQVPGSEDIPVELKSAPVKLSATCDFCQEKIELGDEKGTQYLVNHPANFDQKVTVVNIKCPNCGKEFIVGFENGQLAEMRDAARQETDPAKRGAKAREYMQKYMEFQREAMRRYQKRSKQLLKEAKKESISK